MLPPLSGVGLPEEWKGWERGRCVNLFRADPPGAIEPGDGLTARLIDVGSAQFSEVINRPVGGRRLERAVAPRRGLDATGAGEILKAGDLQLSEKAACVTCDGSPNLPVLSFVNFVQTGVGNFSLRHAAGNGH